MELSNILDDVQKTADAIESVLNIDVTIVDSKLKRIAGTGWYSNNIGDRVSKNSVFGQVLKYKKQCVIENPKEHEYCKQCDKIQECKEAAHLCCPITIGEKAVGIIGLIAFNNDQKKRLIQKKYDFLNYLKRMADLLVSKLIEDSKNNKLKHILSKFEVLINTIDYGVICTNNSGIIEQINAKAKAIFKIDEKFIGENIKKLIGNIKLEKIINKKNIDGEFFKYNYENQEVRGFYNLNLIEERNEVTGILFTFEKMTKIIGVVNKITGSDIVTTFDDIIGESEVIKRVKSRAYKISKSNSTVLINGESGTGKELFARAIHFSSNRRNGPFIPVNCAAIPDNLLESELFGYEEGAFTGARKGGKPGKFELANNGTIFLDEIGDMKLHLQAKLLRVLQENTVEKVGAKNNTPIDVRVIAATHRELHEKVEEGEFREDLFYRLSVIPIRTPSLRDRRSDILIISKKFLKRFNEILNKNIKGFDEEVEEKFMKYMWLGNVRELENVVEYSVNMALDEIIKVCDLPTRFRDTNHRKKEMYEANINKKITPINELEKNEIIKALDLYGRNKKGVTKAAKALGMSIATLYRRIKSL